MKLTSPVEHPLPTSQPSWVTAPPPVGPVGDTARSTAEMFSMARPSGLAPANDPVTVGEVVMSSLGSIDIELLGAAPAGAAAPTTRTNTTAAPLATRPMRPIRRGRGREAAPVTRP